MDVYMHKLCKPNIFLFNIDCSTIDIASILFLLLYAIKSNVTTIMKLIEHGPVLIDATFLKSYNKEKDE